MCCIRCTLYRCVSMQQNAQAKIYVHTHSYIYMYIYDTWYTLNLKCILDYKHTSILVRCSLCCLLRCVWDKRIDRRTIEIKLKYKAHMKLNNLSFSQCLDFYILIYLCIHLSIPFLFSIRYALSLARSVGTTLLK